MATATPSAVRIFAPDHPHLAAGVRAQLEKRRAELMIELLNAHDWGDFCERKGKVRGIDDAIQTTHEVEQALNQRS